ncbi:MAG TPA: hypothetical protein ACHBZA_12870 [Arsenophonus apicola]
MGNSKLVKRLLINDNTDEALKKGTVPAKNNHRFKGTYRKTLTRAAVDLIYGMSITLSCTIEGRKHGYCGVLSGGRVQALIFGLDSAALSCQ